MKKFFAEFKKFITRGNVIDMAVGIIIGSAFTAIVTSVVNDLFMPFITAITGTSLTQWVWVVNGVPQYLADGVTVNPEAIIVHYGSLIQAIINFLLIAIVLFLVIRVINRFRDASASKFFGYTKQEYIAFRKEGKKRKEIEEMSKVRDEEKAAAEKAAEEEAKLHTTEGLLEQIKALLEKQTENNAENKTEENK